MTDVSTGPNPSPSEPRPSWGERLVPGVLLVLIGMDALSVLASSLLPSPESNSWQAAFPAMAAAGSALFLGLVIPLWMMAPLEDAARQRHLPLQFTLVDLACLFLLIQVSTALAYLGSLWKDPSLRWVLTVPAWSVCLMFWAGGVKTLSRAGIVHWRQRAVVLLVAMPLFVASLVGQPIAILTALCRLVGEHASVPKSLISVAVSAVLFLGVWGMRCTVRRMVVLSLPSGENPSELASLGTARLAKDRQEEATEFR